MTIFSCFVRAEIPPANAVCVPEHFTKYAQATDALNAEHAVKAWCGRIGLKVVSILVWPAGDLDRGQYDDPAKVIVA
jgi:hypothetical protein